MRIILLLAVIAAVGCSRKPVTEGETKPGTETNPGTETDALDRKPVPKALVGRWAMTRITGKDGRNEDDGEPMTLEFTADGRFVLGIFSYQTVYIAESADLDAKISSSELMVTKTSLRGTSAVKEDVMTLSHVMSEEALLYGGRFGFGNDGSLKTQFKIENGTLDFTIPKTGFRYSFQKVKGEWVPPRMVGLWKLLSAARDGRTFCPPRSKTHLSFNEANLFNINTETLVEKRLVNERTGATSNQVSTMSDSYWGRCGVKGNTLLFTPSEKSGQTAKHTFAAHMFGFHNVDEGMLTFGFEKGQLVLKDSAANATFTFKRVRTIDEE